MPANQSVLNFFIAVLQDENLKAQFIKALDKKDTPAMLNLAKERGLDFTANELRQGLKHVHNILPNPVEIDNLTLKEYRCTRNASYTANCSGRDDLTARQGYYIHAHSEEEAWQQMASRYPNETTAGFSIQDWSEHSGKSVTVLRVEQDDNGNEVLINHEGKKAITNEKGDVIGYED
jgi:hypothetical protein